MKWIKKLSLKGNNRGASLIAVLVAMIFVSVIGAIVMGLTITNIRMKEMEQASKKNFYSAEKLMDELAANLDDKAAVAMQKAYASMLEDYVSLSSRTAEEIQETYSRRYLNNLEDMFWDQNTTDRNVKRVKVDEELASAEDVNQSEGPERQKPIFIVGSYKISEIKACLPSDQQDCVQISDGLSETDYNMSQDKALFVCDYVNGRFILQNIRIVYVDEQGYESIITTDVVFNTPVLNFTGSNLNKDYMGYALIADEAIDVSAANVKIDGNTYAGKGGIYTSGGNWSSSTSNLNGDMIVTRGSIVANGGQNLVVGNSSALTSQIWAENIVTEGKSTIQIYGNSYISDDLTLNGAESSVAVHGNYYGYNFQEKYDAVAINNSNAAYSSSIVVNAKNATLDLRDTNYLLLAGRTFISRGVRANTSNSQDIMLGESASVRTNQLAYAVTENYLDITKAEDDTITDVKLTASGALNLSEKFGVGNILTYLDTAHPITAYYYIDSSNAGAMGVKPTPRFYLNFASPQAANDFFAACYAKNANTINTNAHDYAGDMAIIMNDSDAALFTLAGDVMYKDPADAVDSYYHVRRVTIDGKWDQDGLVYNAAAEYAVKYKSLQLYLEESHVGLTPADVRFETDDKSDHSVFSNLIDEAAVPEYLKTLTGSVTDQTYVKETGIAGAASEQKRVVVVTTEAQYEVPTTYIQGIIVATGDVVVKGNFEGCIIAKGTVSFTTNATVTSNCLLVSGMLEEERNSVGEMNLTSLFKDYNNLEKDVVGSVALDHYMTFDNWVKSGE